MTRHARTLALAILALAALAKAERVLAQAAATDPAEVAVEGGKVRGTVEGEVIVFKGIPFARPPVGPLRWRAPQPVQPWNGVREANAFGPDPIQPRRKDERVPASPGGTSEDCLYLNVWRPAASSGETLPVMVWIYGGGLVRGGASLYPGQALARQGIVVVTFNYRVGRLGFFAHPALADEAREDPRGNFGYLDQLAALRWVQKNVAAFGGDPRRVTIAGESAGGGSVLVHLTSPLSRGLFHRAILESPGIPGARARAGPMRTLAAAESFALAYAKSNGIEGDDAAALEKLRALPAETLAEGLDEYLGAIFGGPEVPGLSHSIVDGKLVVEPPEFTLRAGQQAQVPVLVGANDADLASSPARTKDAVFALFGPLASRARSLYDPQGDRPLAGLVLDVFSDQTMVEPSRHLAELAAKAGQPAYFYRFSYVVELQRAKARGALHGTEIVYALGLPAAILGEGATKADLDMGRTMSGYWVDFVKTGDPNGGGRPEWPHYDPRRAEVLSFTNAGVIHGADPLKDRLDLWSSVWERSQ